MLLALVLAAHTLTAAPPQPEPPTAFAAALDLSRAPLVVFSFLNELGGDARDLYRRVGGLSVSIPLNDEVTLKTSVRGDPLGALGTGGEDGSVMFTATFCW